MTPFITFLNMHGIEVIIERNGNNQQTVRGLFSSEKDTHRKYCGFLPGTDIKSNDWIIKSETGERLFVVDTESQSFQGKIQQIKAFYETETEHKKSNQSSQQSVFNIQNAYGSVIGTGNTATINYKTSLENIKSSVETTDSPDKEELKQIVALLEMVVNNQVPASKGLFSKFAKVMERNSWITGSVANALISWLLSQIP